MQDVLKSNQPASLLKRLYPSACSLVVYFEQICKGSWTPLREGDLPEYREFLEKTLVYRCPEAREPLPPSQGDRMFEQNEIVNRAIERILNDNGGKGNVLAYGYRRLRMQRGHQVVGTQALENYYPNTISNYLKAPKWQILLERIGTRAMDDLLVHTSIFADIGEGCYLQLSGRSITESMPVNFPASEITPKKRPLEDGQAPDQQMKKPKMIHRGVSFAAMEQPCNQSASTKRPSEIVFSRRKIFYARPIRSSRNKFHFGLPKTHALTDMKSSPEAVTAQLLPIIFPKQYRKGHTSNHTESNAQSRNAKMTQPGKSRKTPWRLKTAKALVTKLIGHYRKLNFNAVLDHYCPKPDPVKPFDVNRLALQSHTKPHHVIAFVNAIIRKVVPRAFFGSVQNQKIFMQAVSQFVYLRRYESMSLQSLLFGFKITDCTWLAPPSRDMSTSIPLSDMQKREEILKEFMYWLMDSLIIPLLRTNFYATESAPYRNRVLYFRQDVWWSLTAKLAENIGQTIYRPIQGEDSEATTTERVLGYSYIRLLPKEQGFRIITNLKRRFLKTTSAATTTTTANAPLNKQMSVSINTILQNAFQVLTFEKSRDPEAFGSSVLGLNDIYTRFKDYKSRLANLNTSGARQKLYFCKVDVTNSFDTIDQSLLLSIVKSALREEEYMVSKYSVGYCSAGRPKRSFLRKARPSHEYPQFTEVVEKLALGMRNAIFVDQVLYTMEERDAILRLLETHLSNNLIKMGKRMYKQVIGIPQGSVLSTILCSFFYAHLEATALSHFRGPDSLLLRYVDDFLYITTDKKRASDFMASMLGGHPSHGCFVNPAKTMVNFPMSVGGNVLPCLRENERDFGWCGLLINTDDLSIKSDYSRFANTYIRDTLTVDTHRPGNALRHKLFQFLKPKCHAIFLDADLNTQPVVFVNLYHNMLHCAIKFCAYIKELRYLPLNLNDVFLIGVLQDAIQFTYFLVQSRVTSTIARGNGCKCGVTEKHVEWLGLYAFSSVLKRKQSRFTFLLQSLNQALGAKRLKSARDQLLPIILNASSDSLEATCI